MFRSQTVVKVHNRKAPLGQPQAIVGVKLLAAVEPAAAVNADNGGQAFRSSFRTVHIQQIFRMLPIGDICKAGHILRIHHTGIPFDVAVSPFFPHLLNSFIHFTHLVILFFVHKLCFAAPVAFLLENFVIFILTDFSGNINEITLKFLFLVLN